MNDIDLRKLAEPFPGDDIEWRLQQSGEKNGKFWAMCLAYVTNRAIMDRLDELVGPGNWRNEYTPGPTGGVLCGISIRVGAEWVTKWDGSENTDIEAVKGGLSSSMKRAAVQWGIGRYLYHLNEGFATIADDSDKKANRGKTKDGKMFKWNPPTLPAWALPGGSGRPTRSVKPKANPRPAVEVESPPRAVQPTIAPAVQAEPASEVVGHITDATTALTQSHRDILESIQLRLEALRPLDREAWETMETKVRTKWDLIISNSDNAEKTLRVLVGKLAVAQANRAVA